MIRIRSLAIAGALALLAPSGSVLALNSATANIIALDKSTTTGLLDARIEFYAPPDAKGNAGTPKVFPAKLLFARPGQFKLVLRAGAKDEYRAVASGGSVSWLDMGTGTAGQGKYETVVDPFTRALLGVAGAISKFAPAKELPMNPNSPMRGAKLTSNVYGTSVITTRTWFYNDKLSGFEFTLSDNSRVFVSILSFKPNVTTKPGDFTL